MVATVFYLPDECWEHIFKFLFNNDDDNNRCYFNSLSIISTQFFSITNRLKFSLTVYDPTRPFLPHLFQRFTNLTSLDFTHFYSDDLDALLSEISFLPFNNLNLKSLNLSNQSKIPVNGLREFSKKITTLTSLTISNIKSLRKKDLIFISHCFPLLEELDLSNSDLSHKNINVGVMATSTALPKLRKIDLSGYLFVNDSLLFHLCKNSEYLQEIVMFKCPYLTHEGIASAIYERPGLTSLSFMRTVRRSNDNISSYFIDSIVSLKGLTYLHLSNLFISDQLLSSIAKKGLPLRRLVLHDCKNYSYAGIFSLLSKCQCIQHLDLRNAGFLNDDYVVELSSFLVELVSINLSHCSMLTGPALFALARNCPSLSEIVMEYTSIGKMSVENSSSMINLVVNPQLKSLCLAHNSYLRDKNIIMFAFICPNLQHLDLTSCYKISEGIGEVLRCRKIRNLNLAYCSGLTLLTMNFAISTLEVLNLSGSDIDDTSLYAISNSCFGLLQLDLRYCYDVTEKGVREVVEKCTKLREINLEHCRNVDASIVQSMVFTSMSLRKITAPPYFRFSDNKRKLFSRHGCLVC